MDPADLLAAYDAQLREQAEVARASSWQRHGPVLWATFAEHGFVTYRSLGGVAGAELDALIAETIAFFRDDTDVVGFEWKTRGHDQPPELPTRLAGHGLVSGEVETVMVGAADALAVDVPLPAEVTVRRAGVDRDLAEDVQRASAMQADVFGRGAGQDPERITEQLIADPTGYQLWLAEADGEVVGAGSVDVVRGTQFAGLWGGGVRDRWRGRGIYRALVAARARAALQQGALWMHSDCTAMSRPILERSGLVAVTTTTPFEWKRDRAAPLPPEAR